MGSRSGRGKRLIGVRVGAPLLLAFLSLSLIQATSHYERQAVSPFPVTPAVPYHPSFLRAEPPDAVEPGRFPMPVQAQLRSGETLARVLAGFGMDGSETHRLASALAEHADLRSLRPGDSYAAFLDAELRVAGFELTLDGRGRLAAARNGEQEGWDVAWHPFERRSELQAIEGTLEGSLEESLRRAGANPAVAYRMADVLQWELDFTRDLRLGDRFEVLYEEIFVDGEPYSVGNVLALTYENRGRLLEAYRYADEGYYDAEGRPLRRMFLRSPLRYSRITSGFSHRRFHPVHRDYRPHWGVDYGAPVGTPVRVTANGVVEFVGWAGGGGRTVRVRHPNGYRTAYLHLSRYGSGMRPGRRVRQGEVIGYVGASGTATGPHLDYRVQKDGRWINPLRLRSVPADPITGSRLAEFERWRDALRASLRQGAPLEEPRSEEPRLAAEAPGRSAEQAPAASAR